MTAKPMSNLLAPLVVATAAALVAANWWLRPDRAWAWGLALALITGMVAALVVTRRATADPGPRRAASDSIRGAVLSAGSILIVALGAKLAAVLGMAVHPEGVRRVTMVLVGGYLAFTGNAIPKSLTPLSQMRCDPARVASAQRFLGWTWTVTGLAFALVWIALPSEVANRLSDVVLVGGMVIGAARVAPLFLGWPRTSR